MYCNYKEKSNGIPYKVRESGGKHFGNKTVSLKRKKRILNMIIGLYKSQ